MWGVFLVMWHCRCSYCRSAGLSRRLWCIWSTGVIQVGDALPICQPFFYQTHSNAFRSIQPRHLLPKQFVISRIMRPYETMCKAHRLEMKHLFIGQPSHLIHVLVCAGARCFQVLVLTVF